MGKVKKVLITAGVVTLMTLSLVGCSKADTIPTSAPVQVTTEADLDIRVNVPTTEVDLGNGTEVAEVVQVYGDNSYSGILSNGDAYRLLDLPKLSTGREFTEQEAMAYQVINDAWLASTEQVKAGTGLEEVRLGVEKSLVGFSEDERREVVEYITKVTSPTPAPQPTQQPTPQTTQPSPQPTQEPAPQPTQPANNVAPTQPTPQPTQAPTQAAPQQTQADKNYVDGEFTAEELAQREKMRQELDANVGDQSVTIHYEGNLGYDSSGTINIQGN